MSSQYEFIVLNYSFNDREIKKPNLEKSDVIMNNVLSFSFISDDIYYKQIIDTYKKKISEQKILNNFLLSLLEIDDTCKNTNEKSFKEQLNERIEELSKIRNQIPDIHVN